MSKILIKTRILALIKAIKLSAILLFILVTIMADEGVNVYNYVTGPKEIYELNDIIDNTNGFNSLKEQYIKLAIYFIYGPILEYHQEYYIKNRTFGSYGTDIATGIQSPKTYYYFMPVREDYYIAVEVLESEKEEYDKLYKQTQDDSEYSKLPSPIIFTGGFYEANLRFRQEAENWFKDAGFDVKHNGLDYYLSPYIMRKGYDISFLCFFIFIVGATTVGLVVVWFKFFINKNVREVKYYLGKLSYEQSYSIEADYANSVKSKGIALGESWCFNFNKNSMDIIPYEDIVWMYTITEKDMVNRKSILKSTGIILHDANGIKEHILCKGVNEAKINEMMQQLYKRHPNMFIGYKDDYIKLYKRDYNNMIDIVKSKTECRQKSTI